MYRNTHLNILSSMASLAMLSSLIHPLPDYDFGRKRPHAAKTGKTYPHSSTRQRARYARQIAAGQLKF